MTFRKPSSHRPYTHFASLVKIYSFPALSHIFKVRVKFTGFILHAIYSSFAFAYIYTTVREKIVYPNFPTQFRTHEGRRTKISQYFAAIYFRFSIASVVQNGRYLAIGARRYVGKNVRHGSVLQAECASCMFYVPSKLRQTHKSPEEPVHNSYHLCTYSAKRRVEPTPNLSFHAEFPTTFLRLANAEGLVAAINNRGL